MGRILESGARDAVGRRRFTSTASAPRDHTMTIRLGLISSAERAVMHRVQDRRLRGCAGRTAGGYGAGHCPAPVITHSSA